MKNFRNGKFRNQLFDGKCQWQLQQQQKMMNSKAKIKSKNNIERKQRQKGTCGSLGESELGQIINNFVNSNIYTAISTILMVYTLFADDIRQIYFSPDADIIFTYINLAFMIYYTFEIIVFSLFQKDYFLKYYFWLDILSTITMSFDLIWLNTLLTGNGRSAANVAQISRASRAARLGTRTVKMIRILRMIKLIKQVKNASIDLKMGVEQPTKKLSQRLSSIHSKLHSLRNIERHSSLRHMQKFSSRRWSLIKQTNFMNFGGNNNNVLTSLNCLPAKQKDAIINELERDGAEREMESIKQAELSEIPQIKKGFQVRNKIINLQNIQYIKKQPKNNVINLNIAKSKKSPLDKTNKNISEQSSDKTIDNIYQSKFGAQVQNQIQKNVILMIIVVLISIPLLDGTTWFGPQSVYSKEIESLVYFANSDSGFYPIQARKFISSSKSFLNPLLFFSIKVNNIQDQYPDNYYGDKTSDIINSFRTGDLDVYSDIGYTVAYDISWYNKQISYMNIGRTLFICILLIIGTIFFSNDIEYAAIAPLEDMFQTIKKIAIHPLNAIREIEEKNLCLENVEEFGAIPNTQPKVLQNTIVKIGSLLAVGFGEAGTEIICKVIEDPSIIDVMIPGQKIMAIFGFCDIRNFTDATEVLQANVMVFVNQIAAICHQVTYEHLGSPNKNIGDAFLLVWKFSKSDCKITQTPDQTTIELLKTPKVSQTADLAVLALIKMIADITKAQSLQKYKKNKNLQQRIPNYTGVKMGFGLHVGWAIQGPIGSQYKIDASYLGSNVHMASRLEGATKAYGTSMLITGSVYNIMTENRSNLRHIDRVIPSGQAQITELYTVDVVPMHLFQVKGVKEEKNLSQKDKKFAKVCQNIARKDLLQNITKNDATDSLWNDEDIKILQQPYSLKFYQEWKKGFNHYLEGSWEQALSKLNSAKNLAPGGSDGPTQSLIKFIQQHKCKAPDDWKGHRDFD